MCYSATNLLFRENLPKKYGGGVTLLDTTDTEAVRAAVRPNTKLIHVRPWHPTTGISDIDAMRRSPKGRGAAERRLPPSPAPCASSRLVSRGRT